MKLLLPIFFLTIFLLAPTSIFAASLEVSNNPSFGVAIKDFSVGETIYIRMNSDDSGDKQKVVNVRKNDYSLLKSYPLNKNGNMFSASFPVPGASGYYSLEARVESSDSSSVSVVTIRVGDVQGVNIKVNVNNNTSSNVVIKKEESGPAQVDQRHSDEATNVYTSDKNVLESRASTENIGSGSFWFNAFEFMKRVWDIVWIF